MSFAGQEAERFMKSKAFLASYQGINRKTTYDTDEREYRSLDWALLPPPTTTAEREKVLKPLAETFAIIARKRGGLPEDKAVKGMLEIREDLYKSWLGQYLYFYMGPPRFRPLPVMLGIWEMPRRGPRRAAEAARGLQHRGPGRAAGS